MSDPVRRSLCDAVDGSVLMAHMGEFARWVKLSGTPDELTSLHYVKGRLDEFGYRTELLHHDAYISLPGRAAGGCGQPGADQHHALVLASRRRRRA